MSRFITIHVMERNVVRRIGINVAHIAAYNHLPDPEGCSLLVNASDKTFTYHAQETPEQIGAMIDDATPCAEYRRWSEISRIISDWASDDDMYLEVTWPIDLHPADILDKHIFPQLRATIGRLAR